MIICLMIYMNVLINLKKYIINKIYLIINLLKIYIEIIIIVKLHKN